MTRSTANQSQSAEAPPTPKNDARPVPRLSWVLSVAGIFGIYYLLAYTHSEGLEFPITISELPSIAAAVGLLALIIYIWCASILVSSSIFFSTPLAPACLLRLRILETRAIRGPKLRFSLHVFSFQALPLAGFFIVSYFNSVYWLLAVPFITAGFLVAVLRLRRKTRWYDLLTVASIAFSASFLLIISALVYSLTLVLAGVVSNWGEVAAALAILGLVNSISHLDFSGLGQDRRIRPAARSGQDDKSTFAKWVGNFIAPLLVLVVFTMLSLEPPVASALGAIALRIMNIGGGLQRTFYVSHKDAEQMPKELFVERDGNICITRPVSLLLDIGNEVYVRIASNRLRGNLQLKKGTLFDYPRGHTQLEMLKEQDAGLLPGPPLAWLRQVIGN